MVNTDPWHTKDGARLRAEMQAHYRAIDAPCWICAQRIDYDAPANNPEALDIDHVKPRKTHRHLALDRNNLRPSHCRCNRSKGVGAAKPPLGTVTESW